MHIQGCRASLAPSGEEGRMSAGLELEPGIRLEASLVGAIVRQTEQQHR